MKLEKPETEETFNIMPFIHTHQLHFSMQNMQCQFERWKSTLMTDSKAQWLTCILLFGGSPGTIQTALLKASFLTSWKGFTEASGDRDRCRTTAVLLLRCYNYSTSQTPRCCCFIVSSLKHLYNCHANKTKINMCQTSNLNKTSFFKDTCSR